MRRFLLLVVALLVTAGLAFGKTPIRVQSWHLGEFPWRDAWNEFEKAVEAKYPDIDVQLDPVTYANKEQVFTTQSEAGIAADIAHFTYRPISVFIEKGYLMDLTPFLAREPAFKAGFLPGPLSMASQGGKVYALPDDFDIIVLVYNKKLFRAAGLDPNKPPATWDEFVDYARKLTRDLNGDGNPDQWGYGLIAKREEGLFMRLNPWFWGAGGDYLTPDGKHSALNTPQALEGFRFYTDLATVYKVAPPGAADIGVQDNRVLFANNKVAMIVGTAWTPPIIDRINPNFNSAENLAMAPMPAKVLGNKPVSSAFISMRVISAKTKHPEEAWKVYRYIYSQENQERWFRYMHLPSSIAAIRSSPMTMNDLFAGTVARAADSHDVMYEPLIPEWLEIGDAMITAVQETVSGTKPAEKALTDAHRRVEGIIAR